MIVSLPACCVLRREPIEWPSSGADSGYAFFQHSRICPDAPDAYGNVPVPADAVAVTVSAESWPRYGDRRYERPDNERDPDLARALIIPAPGRLEEALSRLLELTDRKRDVNTNPDDIGGYAVTVPPYLHQRYVS